MPMTPLDKNGTVPKSVMITMDENQSSEETSSGSGMIKTEDVIGSHSTALSQGFDPIQSHEADGRENGFNEPFKITVSDPEVSHSDAPNDEPRTTTTMDSSTDKGTALPSELELKAPSESRGMAIEYVKHVGTYFSEVESRIAFLERELEKLRPNHSSSNESAVSEAESDSEDVPEPAELIPDIRHVSWSSFKPDLAFQEGEDDHYTAEAPTHVLEVLIEHHRCGLAKQIPKTPGKDTPSRKLARDNRNKISGDIVVPRTALDRAQHAERLRITSKPLLALLSKVCGTESGMPADLSKAVFLRPYKLFMVFEQEIREQFELLKAKNEPMSELAGSGSPEDVQTATSPHTNEEPTNDKGKEQSKEGSETATCGKVGETGVESCEAALQHLGLLERFFDNDLKSTFELRSSLKTGTADAIEYADLWHLFEPGQEVRSADSKLQIYHVTKFTGGRDPLMELGEGSRKAPNWSREREDDFSIECYRYDFDGFHYGPVFEQFTIGHYEGLREITCLPVYPWLFDPDYSEAKKKLLERGNKFIELTHTFEISHKAYTGLSLDGSAEEIDSPIIIDFRLALRKHRTKDFDIGLQSLLSYDPHELQESFQKCRIVDCCSNEYIFQDHDLDSNQSDKFMLKQKRLLELRVDGGRIEDELRILLPYYVYGFVLLSRKWATFNIDDVRDVVRTSSFDDLILPPGHKETVEALVRRHSLPPKATPNAANEMASMDLVKGKGKGLIILLHGAPGVGKTSTAECVADQTKRPLFPITCGDLGESAIDVEKNLEQNFEMARKWGCVFLLDEADVFLAERQKADLGRNAVVSVFLRTLEYYSGILFLTTNRVGSLDPAFKSRIHISFYYPQLNKQTTKDIWKTHVKKAKEYFKGKGEVERSQILRFSMKHFKELKKDNVDPWNGRQIRNAFQTAIALAEHQASQHDSKLVLSESQFEQVAKASKIFDSYLNKVHGGYNEAEIARAKALRNDLGTREKIAKDQNTARRKAKDEPETTEDDDESSDNSTDDEEEENETEVSSSSSPIDRSDGNSQRRKKRNGDKAKTLKENKPVREKKKKQRHDSSEEEAPTKKSKKKDVSKHQENSDGSSEEMKVVKRSSKEKESNKTTSKSFKKEKS